MSDIRAPWEVAQHAKAHECIADMQFCNFMGGRTAAPAPADGSKDDFDTLVSRLSMTLWEDAPIVTVLFPALVKMLDVKQYFHRRDLILTAIAGARRRERRYPLTLVMNEIHPRERQDEDQGALDQLLESMRDAGATVIMADGCHGCTNYGGSSEHNVLRPIDKALFSGILQMKECVGQPDVTALREGEAFWTSAGRPRKKIILPYRPAPQVDVSHELRLAQLTAP